MTTPYRAGSESPPSEPAAIADLQQARFPERELLGALLRHPQRAEELHGWLKAADFVDPEHRAVYATITGLHEQGRLQLLPADSVVPSDLGDQRINRLIVDNQTAVAESMERGEFTGVPVEDYRNLMFGLQVAAARAAEAPVAVYGQIVLELSVRRQVQELGVRLEAAATTDRTFTGDPAPLKTSLREAEDRLRNLVLQNKRSAGAVVGTLEPSIVPGPRMVPTAPLPPTLVERKERTLVHTVLADPVRHGLLDLLRPEDFATAAAATAWQGMWNLRQRGIPVNPVTVWWELEKQPGSGRGQSGTALTPVELNAMRATPLRGADVDAAVTVVARASLTRIAGLARERIEHAAADRGLDVGTVVQTTVEAAATLDRQASRLLGATGGLGATAVPDEVSVVTRRLGPPVPTRNTGPHIR